MKHFLLLICVVFFLLAAETSNAQKIPDLREVQSWNLPSVTKRITVYYSPGYEQRALEVGPLVEEMMKFYAGKLNIKENFYVAMLAREKWNEHFKGFPYGLLIVKNGIAFVPATSDGVLTEGALAREKNASAATLKKIKKSGFGFDEAARKLPDLILLHELGHVFTQTYGIKPPNNWLTEFLASYFAYAFLREKHPKLARLFQAMVTDIYLEGYTPKYTSLADFERLFLGVGPENYSWYQAHFLQKGAEIYRARKFSFLADARQAFPATAVEKLSPDATFERLEKISPGFIEWSKRFK